jgi:membrane protein YqaA with SNARE-associated domain
MAQLVIALLWGFAEATFFFLVPDVWLSFLAVESFTAGVAASLVALAGALNGGAMFWLWGRNNESSAKAFLCKIPAIGPELVEKVAGQIASRGVVAVLLGPLQGIPYKIYAVESGARNRSLAAFLLISIPARYIRFFVAVAAFALAAKYLLPFGLQGKRIAVAVFWTAFYAFYFRKFGWNGK